MTPKKLAGLDAFRKESVGLGYQVKTTHLLLTQRSTPNLEQANTYFCSELIAKAFKKMGIIEDKKSSASYFPGAFEEDGVIDSEIIKPDSLGPMHSILVDANITPD